MNRTHLLIALFLASYLGTPVLSQDTPALPSVIRPLAVSGYMTVSEYKLVRLSADNVPADAAVIWDLYPEESLDIEELGQRLIFTGPPGEYKYKLRSIVGKQVQTVRGTVVIQRGVGPSPVPPGPPQPIPPTDPFSLSVQSAYNAETDPAKAQQVALLAEVFAQGARDVVPAVATTKELLAKMLIVRRAVVADNQLTSVRLVVDTDIVAVLGRANLTLDAATKEKAAVEFNKIAVALKGVR